jgi:iron complex outermembrane receptor protein
MTVMKKHLPASLLFILLLNLTPAFAQAPTLTGRVLDQNNTAVAGVVVALTRSDGAVRQTVTTGPAGAFSFENLPAGSYRLLVSRQGFAVQELSVEAPFANGSLEITLKPDAARYSITVAAENDSFAAVEAVSATRMPLPLSELPQSVGVVDRAVIDSEQAGRIADAARNVSGVERDAAFRGDVQDMFTIRGITLDVFNNYYRDGYRYEGGTPSEVANVEQLETLKGPASVIYGRAEAGGVVNLVTVKPRERFHHVLTTQADRFGVFRPQFDSTGPLTNSGKLLYRVVGLYGHAESFRDQAAGNRFFLNPQLLWKLSPRTTLNFEGEYLWDRIVTDYGVTAAGARPAPIPVSTFLGEPWNRSKYQGKWAGLTFNHQFTNNWNITNGFRATFFNWDFYDVYPVALLSDNRTLTRQVEDANYPRRFFNNQTNVIGVFNSGPFRHTLLAGFELSRQKIRQIGAVADVPPIDIFQPVYASLTRPPRSTFLFPDAPGFFPFDADQRFTSLGGYAQDQIAIWQKLSVNVAVRFEDYRQRFRDFGFGSDNSQTDRAVVSRVGVVYHPVDQASLYASFSQSYSPAIATLLNASGKPFDPTRGSQYEGGVKWSLFSGRLLLTSAAYLIRVRDVLTQDPGNPLISIQSGRQQSKGLEFDLAGKIAPGWNLLFNYAFTQATIIDDKTFPVGNLLTNAPRHSGNLWTVYEIQRGRLAGLGFGGGVFTRSQRAGDLFNSYFLPGYARVDATVSYNFGRGEGESKRYTLAVNIQNALDRRYYESGRTAVTVYPGSPINVMTKLQIHF